MKSNLRNEIKSYIVRQGMTMQEVVDLLRDEHGWSDSVSNLSNKLQRESLRYVEAVQLADALGYEIVWQKRRSETCSMSGMPATSARNAVSVIKSKATPANRWDFLPMDISRTRTIPSIGSLMKKLHKLSGAFLI